MNTTKLLAAAKAGKLAKILELSGCLELGPDDDDTEAALLAYKWLAIAADFGHDIEDELSILENGTSLHYDDQQMATGSVHLELGEAYLRGEDGLPVDHTRAREHLEEARTLELHVTTDVEKSAFPGIRKRLGSEALAVFDSVFPPKPSRKNQKKKPGKVKPKAGGRGRPEARKVRTRRAKKR